MDLFDENIYFNLHALLFFILTLNATLLIKNIILLILLPIALFFLVDTIFNSFHIFIIAAYVIPISFIFSLILKSITKYYMESKKIENNFFNKNTVIKKEILISILLINTLVVSYIYYDNNKAIYINSPTNKYSIVKSSGEPYYLLNKETNKRLFDIEDGRYSPDRILVDWDDNEDILWKYNEGRISSLNLDNGDETFHGWGGDITKKEFDSIKPPTWLLKNANIESEYNLYIKNLSEQKRRKTDPNYHTKIANDYKKGINGKVMNPNQAIFWYLKAAEAGNCESQFKLAEEYMNNNKKRLFWLKKAATNNLDKRSNTKYKRNLNLIHKSPLDYKSQSQYELGQYYFYSKNDRDINKVVYWTKKAYLNGHNLAISFWKNEKLWNYEK